MADSSPYQHIEKTWREIERKRSHEDAEFDKYVRDVLSSIDNEKEIKLAQHEADTKTKETELAAEEQEKSKELEAAHLREREALDARHKAQTTDRERDQQAVMSRLRDERSTAWEQLRIFFSNKKDNVQSGLDSCKATLKADRLFEDDEIQKNLFKAMVEQSNQTIEVASSGAASSCAELPPQRILNFKTRIPATSTEEKPTRAVEKGSVSTADLHTSRSRGASSQVTPTKRSMAESPYENIQPPSLRRAVSENIRPATAENVLNLSSPPAPSKLFGSSKTSLPVTPCRRPASPSYLVPPSSSFSQAAIRATSQAAAPSTPLRISRQTISANSRLNGSSLPPPADTSLLMTPTPPRAMLRSPFKSSSQHREISPGVPRQSAEFSSQQDSLPGPTNQNRPLCLNFEIIAVRYKTSDGENFVWTREAEEGPKYYRLSDNTYRPVLKQGRSCGTPEWIIDPSRVWFLKYNLEAALLYINRKKGDAKTGNAGKEMWVKFKDEIHLEGFLKSYKENWEHIKIDKLDLDDDEVPLSMAKSCR
ncbi:hypothetical protein ONS95_000638 [Cadophora gregata]|uniref:uncharacterized protein n=1 Tax=Cadophora gregata TaxID=51156 RepID=UPI0026DA97BE|nr:uncharacterized protein ONS95_000638 [Cadophora gregata]KAK0125339.1 hypothetical protein ONS96_009188 [Cadophora gregata f. sp. sojae]KAK0128681.1 hypothetical protein ONS95_000638 [Cadophora gregata]